MTVSTTTPTSDAPAPRAPDVEPTEGARRPRRPRSGGGLADAVDAGLRALRDLEVPRLEAVSGALERMLVSALVRHEERSPVGPGAEPDGVMRHDAAAVALRVACAYLGAGDLAEARFALEDAHDALPHRDRRVADPPDRAEEALRRDLRDRAVLAQAVGVLTQSTDASPSVALAALRAHADRHRFVVVELAADVVAGRVAPGAVTARRPRTRRGRR